MNFQYSKGEFFLQKMICLSFLSTKTRDLTQRAPSPINRPPQAKDHNSRYKLS